MIGNLEALLYDVPKEKVEWIVDEASLRFLIKSSNYLVAWKCQEKVE